MKTHKYDRFKTVITITGLKGMVMTLPSADYKMTYGVECEEVEENWQQFREEALFDPDGDRFQLIRSFPQGHYFFMDVQTQRLAIIDPSKDNPELTKNGVLYLDTKGLISASPDNLMLPLRSLDGQTGYALSNPAQAFWCAATFGMKVTDEMGSLYKAIKLEGGSLG